MASHLSVPRQKWYRWIYACQSKIHHPCWIWTTYFGHSAARSGFPASRLKLGSSCYPAQHGIPGKELALWLFYIPSQDDQSLSWIPHILQACCRVWSNSKCHCTYSITPLQAWHKVLLFRFGLMKWSGKSREQGSKFSLFRMPPHSVCPSIFKASIKQHGNTSKCH